MEEYKKKYEEAMLRMNKWVEGSEIVDPKGVAEFVFPELKESEDEKIKKTLINFLDDVWHLGKNANFDKYGKADCAEWIVWLKKQDPKKHEEELEKAYKTADEVQYRKGYEDAKREFEKQGEQKVVKFMTKSYTTPNPEFFQWIYDRLIYQHHENPDIDYMRSLKERIEDMQEIVNVKASDVLVKQNPVWSEEDEKMWSTISDLLWEGYKLSDKKVSWNKIRCWLLPKIKSLKERVQHQPKQEWSEEDEKLYTWCASAIQTRYNDGLFTMDEYRETSLWLKSLKERYTWKPSDEQIKALNYVINLMASSESPTENDYYYNVFKDMRTQLKKLR